MRSNLTKIVLAAALVLAITLTLSCSSGDKDDGPGTDSDGDSSGPSLTGTSGSFAAGDETYKWVKIGNQFWMAKNLNYNASGSKCYDNLETNCVQYGRLYDWATAMGLQSSCNSTSCASQIKTKHKGICPEGWHIPNKAEWETLMNYVYTEKSCTGSDDCVGKYLKTNNGWKENPMLNPGPDNGNGTDDYGFAALPGGYCDSEEGFCESGSDEGFWWSASEESGRAYRLGIASYFVEWNPKGKDSLRSVRCVKD